MDKEIRDKYEAVIGLEVHAQLLTKSKIYNSDSTEYGSKPNTNLSAITLAHPGTLPKLNKKVVEYAIKMGLACGCEIARKQIFDRKNYFYPDLPKGYQITQDRTPICSGGFVHVRPRVGEERDIKLTKIHIEEDAGKSIHLAEVSDTLVDFNRSGVPLIEIVSEPDIRTSEEAHSFLTEVRKLVRYLDICDGNMEEGSLRCDANVSVMLKGADTYGVRVEVKNMNSIRNVQKAIDHEIVRQIENIEAGNTIVSETRTFDASTCTTASMRAKERLNDYRYFPDPDLSPLVVSEEWLAELKAQIPSLPNELYSKYITEFGLSEYDAQVLTDSKEIALYFEELCGKTNNYKAASNWIMGPVKSYMNDSNLTIEHFPLTPETLADVIKLVDDNKMSFSLAAQSLFPALIQQPQAHPLRLAEEMSLVQDSDGESIGPIVEQVLARHPDKVAAYKKGKTGLLGMFIGEVMKLTKGKADPKLTDKIVREKLNNKNMTMKVLSAAVAILLVCGSCTSQSSTENNNSVVLSGSVGFPQQGLILLDEITPDGQLQPKDTITLNEDYTFSKEIAISDAGIFRLNFYNQQFVNLILENDDVEVKVDGNNRAGFSQISGSSDHDYINDAQAYVGSFQTSEEIQLLNQEFMAARDAQDEEKMGEIQKRYFAMEAEHNKELLNKIDEMGTSLAAIQLMNSIDRNKNFDFYVKIADKFKEEKPNNLFAQQFISEVEGLKKVAVGMMAPELALPNPDGEIVKLSSFRGKYVLVDFWAKWCKPCRLENPNVVKAYNKYKDKGFEVFGVSLDRKKEDWLQAIEQDGLTWTHVSDLKFWQSEAARIYNIKSIPFALLLDKEGKIIAKNLRGAALDAKLEELMGE